MNHRTALARRTVEAVSSTPPPPLDAVPGISGARGWIDLDLGVRELWILPDLHWIAAGEPPPDEPSHAIALCHPSGRIREAALESAAAPAVLPLVAVRCADWVRPVRERALEVLRKTLPDAGPRTLVAVAAVVLRLAARRHGGVARDLAEEILRSAGPEAADALLAADDRAARRLGHRIAIEQERLSPARLAAIAAADEDVVVQQLCADAALAAVREGARDGAREGARDEARYNEVLPPLLRSRHPRVRASGVTELHRAGRPGEAVAFLSDRAPLVRACARWVLRQHGIDPLPLHRAACSSPGVSPGAAAGLGDCGTREDAALLWPLLADPRPPVRARAVAALRALDAVEPERLAPLLDDPSATVIRETATALTPYAARLPEGPLFERLAADRPRSVRTSMFRLLAAHRPMVALRCFLTALDDPDLHVRARTTLTRWSPADATPAYRALPGDERASLDRLLERAATVLDERQHTLLRWSLGTGR
ncbi:hypothetical protein [Streptomyces sp. I05A-00742]|uniref:hypothetical protein n=1 Tax=Streptomyces sp. I05A-00742 TaxID=2732853 RepID=UPI0014877816|nr:hypothetical protein [Streptomyces sp. I05A-00742]